jgi:Tol biopolymer transport system component
MSGVKYSVILLVVVVFLAAGAAYFVTQVDYGKQENTLTVDSSFSNEKILYSTMEKGYGTIGIIDMDGSNEVILCDNHFNDEQPDWSPDNSQIVFVSNRKNKKELYIMDSDGTNQDN